MRHTVRRRVFTNYWTELDSFCTATAVLFQNMQMCGCFFLNFYNPFMLIVRNCLRCLETASYHLCAERCFALI